MPKKPNNDDFRATAGYYNHVSGAHYINPFKINNTYPELVEIHESLHEGLANSNVLDSLVILFSNIYLLGKEKLNRKHLESLKYILKIIHENTVFIHEVVATYLSFKIFNILRPESYEKARLSLPKFYMDALSAGEQSFGKIEDKHNPRTVGIILMTIAKASMNIDIDLELISFDNLRACAKSISKTSPYNRFNQILNGLEPYWYKNSIISHLKLKIEKFEEPDAKDYQKLEPELIHELTAAIIKVIRKEFPKIKFNEEPPSIKDLVKKIKEDGHNHGYTFLSTIDFEPIPKTPDMFESGAQFIQPELPEDYILDLSIKQINYTKGSFKEFVNKTHICYEEKRCLFCHVMVSLDENGFILLSCFPNKWWILNKTNIIPIVFGWNFNDLITYLKTLPRESIILKIDERVPEKYPIMLAKTGHFVIKLFYNTHQYHITNSILKEAKKQKVALWSFKLFGDSLVFLIIFLSKDKYTLMTPITDYAFQLLTRNVRTLNNIKFYEEEEDFLNDFPIRKEFLYELIFTTYIGIAENINDS